MAAMNEIQSENFLQDSNLLTATGTFDRALALTELHLPDGRVVRLPTALLQGSEVSASLRSGALDDMPLEARLEEQVVIPLVEEQLEVGKRNVVTGIVRLHKTVQEFQTALDEPLAVRSFDVERVILNQPIEAAPHVRYEGDTTIYPLVEEQLILTKQLILKEEIRVTQRDTERRDTRTVILRREHLVVERDTPDGLPEESGMSR